jgi:hypothetical protein
MGAKHSKQRTERPTLYHCVVVEQQQEFSPSVPRQQVVASQITDVLAILPQPQAWHGLEITTAVIWTVVIAQQDLDWCLSGDPHQGLECVEGYPGAAIHRDQHRDERVRLLCERQTGRGQASPHKASRRLHNCDN